MTIEDLMAALITHLKNDADVAAIVDTRVFGVELPAAETPNMPRAALVLTQSGGLEPPYTATLELDAPRIDAFSYGATPFEAMRLARATRGALRAIQRLTVGTTLIHWVTPAGGRLSQREPETRWPRVFESFSVMGSEKGVS